MALPPLPTPGPADGPPDIRRAAAFVGDPDTKRAVQAGLPEWEVEAHDGNIGTAVGVLASVASPELILVDLDGVPYPVGSIHELASVCEPRSVVVALGSWDSARDSRDILITGVADYLVKPVAPARLREVVADALAGEGDRRGRGRSACFAGTGGSGATTLLAATAITAAARGRYVAVLDLNRAFGSLPFLLGVEPVPGLDELLESAAAGAPDPELVDVARISRSDRISVFGYRWNRQLPPLAPVRNVRHLLADLCRRFHLVLVDPEALGRAAVLRACNVQVLVSEPTRIGTLRFAGAFAALEAASSAVQVRNRTRPLGRSDVRKALAAAGAARAPDLEIPFDETLPELADRGHLTGQLPRRLQKPLGRLADLLDAAGAGQPQPAVSAAA
ncbi:MAG: hypothetical protein OXF78_10340 [Rhodospirillales bacterium]|nr:hypothetical protein [Rhodospirillales bacterium]